MQPKLLIIIPAYNEGKNIEHVVNNLTENYPQYDYVVVNDDVEHAAQEILSILAAEKCRTKKRLNYLKEEL